jgi:hypothetical protein
MYLVLELPTEGLPRCRRGKTEQDATIHVQSALAKIVNVGEKLRSDPMILLTQRDEMAGRARLSVGLKSRLHECPGRIR